ncbi:MULTISPECIES: helix-turn-helix domain-containing protein [Amycolatopsis]|jgi:transcriptional regulator with XRE-family HTH domain|uniref:Transcriptional regulator, contains XRE-family HTH domain n=3 Tax=Amycolatopsis TaxID=1813 RepID=A0A1H4Z1D2_9PSEU|nr:MULTISPECIES: helix-turn-helix transcriptional regulator [Amycolatopsis]KDN19004.1 XRE family transcriptional regulator [Amycolatopsis rifamycinica]MBE1502590.1 transcriptional regulator with XRE-family HTH domain [Amycolatopsis lexingtonensis]NED44806.1 helix-turn-helix transcriptional regulator [Amycolatopsis sp. SID8362]SED23767.1 Transcriptional regulator, contains XRE-family HTH domain [Amycolatopsis tolypomycina]HET6710322.1 helix-turn-helix transcriptional regulator [Amycolatopsis sp
MTVLLREAIGDRLRHARTNQRRTLRDISRAARVSLGYLSEVERGQKEASSELLASICQALDLPLGELLHNVAADVSALDNVEVAPVDERIVEGAPREKRGAEASAAGIEGGRLMSELIGNDLADLRVSPAPRMNTTLRTTIGQPKLASTIAA